MLIIPQSIAKREKSILAGLYLAKYDVAGLKSLGFENFTEAFNVIGYGLGGRPASIKNYRDEFDPFFPNPRAGWHKRPIRDYCLKVLRQYENLDYESFTGLVQSFFGYDENVLSNLSYSEEEADGDSQFAKRLITGLAAENYFEAIQPKIPEFNGYRVENTSRLGCGYDFRLRDNSADFLAVEVKGLKERNGSLYMTPKEHDLAAALGPRFFLFVVKNFRETPFHEIYQNPISSSLQFAKKERAIIQVSWLTSV
ncbi:MAG: DUF3883 domain-containing protein [Chthoniobacterales bacterium]